MPVQIIDFSLDVQSELDRRTHEVTAEMEKLLLWVTAGPARSQQLHQVGGEVRKRLMHIGVRVLLLWVASRLPKSVPATLQTGRGWYRCVGMVEAVVRSRFGEFWARRPEYALVHGEGPKRLAPFDRDIGLAAGRMSLGVHLVVGQLVTKLAFEPCREIVALFDGYAPSTRSMHGIVDQLGPQAAMFMEDLPAPEDDGEILVMESDHKGAPHMGPEEHRKRRKKHVKRPRGLSKRAYRRWRRRQKQQPRKEVGTKSKNARMASIGVVYTLRLLPDGSVEGPINRRIFGTFKGARALFRIMKKDAVKRGYGKKKCIFLADGEKQLWDLWQEFFPEATPCLDWYHLSEYLWTAGGAIHRPKPKNSKPTRPSRRRRRRKASSKLKKTDKAKAELKEWVESRQDELRRDDVDAVLKALRAARAAIPRTGPGTATRRRSVDRATTYVENHRDYMPYGELTKQGLVIGTGNIEGAAKYIGRRLDGPGMRWSTERSEHVLALVCVTASDQWEGFAASVTATHERLDSWRIERITPNRPMTPHKARKKAA